MTSFCPAEFVTLLSNSDGDALVRTAPRGALSAALSRHTRNHGEYMATGGDGMGSSELQRLKSFHDKLRRYNLVVEYSPEIPPFARF